MSGDLVLPPAWLGNLDRVYWVLGLGFSATKSFRLQGLLRDCYACLEAPRHEETHPSAAGSVLPKCRLLKQHPGHPELQVALRRRMRNP